MRDGRIESEKLGTHRFALGDIMEAYDVFAAADENDALKVVLTASGVRDRRAARARAGRAREPQRDRDERGAGQRAEREAREARRAEPLGRRLAGAGGGERRAATGRRPA